MRFRFKADIEFDSDSAETAMLELARHFIGVAKDFIGDSAEGRPAWFTGNLQLAPADEIK